MLKVRVRSYWTPKADSSIAEYEDASFLLTSGTHKAPRMDFAIADGASEGMLSSQWARILVRALCRLDGSYTDIDVLLTRAYHAWQQWKQHYVHMRERQNRPIQWYEEPGLERGAFATLLGLSLTFKDKTGEWHAAALGDSCLFQIRSNQLIHTFPVTTSTHMNNRPYLISSNPTHNAAVHQHMKTMQGECRSGDRFLLMTDALADWCFHQHEAGRAPWSLWEFENTLPQSSFERQMALLRATHNLRNDDVTLIAIGLD